MRKAALAATLAAAVAAGTLAATAGASRESARGPAAKVGIHGEWTIAIRTRHGKLVRRVRFHNDFVGEDGLAGLLSYQTSLEGWAIDVQDANPSGGPCDMPTKGGGTKSNVACWLSDPKHPAYPPAGLQGSVATSSTLTLKTAPAQLVLHGTATAGAQGDKIAIVATEVSTCPFGTTKCGGQGTTFVFTERKLDPSAWIPVAGGQVIDVTVTLTFSNVTS